MVNTDLDLEKKLGEVAADTMYLRGSFDNLNEKIKGLYNKVARELRDVHYKLDHLIDLETEPSYYRGGLKDFFEEYHAHFPDLNGDD